MTSKPLRILLVPDSLEWITGTMAKNIVRFNPWISAAIVSGPVLDEVFGKHSDLIEKFDLVHFLDQYSSRDWLPRFLPSTPVVTTHHHVADWEMDRHNMDGDAIVVVAREWEDDLRARGIPMENVVRYSNGVDAVTFAPPTQLERTGMRADLGVPEENVLVGFFAKRGSNNHNDRKGTDVLSTAAVSLADNIDNLSLLIVGPGWETLVSELRQKRVHCIWKPFVKDNASMRRMYHALDFYWITSRVEGGPVPLLEAMSCGVCCVTTSVGLVPEMGVDRENLVLVPFDDAEAVASATAELASKPEERGKIGSHARQTILDKKHLAITTRGIAAAYDLAFDNFSQRTKRARAEVPDVDSMMRACPIEIGASPPEITPLVGIPQNLHSRITMCENIQWGDTLFQQDQRAEGLHWLWRECRRHPLSGLAWRRYLRRAMPQGVVKTIVSFRKLFGGAQDKSSTS